MRQGDTVSPQLFAASPEEAFGKLGWENSGIRVNGEYLSHLEFAGDIVLFCVSGEHLHRKPRELHSENSAVALGILGRNRK